MKVIVIDGQGGGIGSALVSAIKSADIEGMKIIGIGANALATSAMLRAGADVGATGENAVAVNSEGADVIVGPIGIILADSMYGEITAKMAAAVASSSAKKLLIPVSKSSVTVMGTQNKPLAQYIAEAAQTLKSFLD